MKGNDRNQWNKCNDNTGEPKVNLLWQIERDIFGSSRKISTSLCLITWLKILGIFGPKLIVKVRTFFLITIDSNNNHLAWSELKSSIVSTPSGVGSNVLPSTWPDTTNTLFLSFCTCLVTSSDTTAGHRSCVSPLHNNWESNCECRENMNRCDNFSNFCPLK